MFYHVIEITHTHTHTRTQLRKHIDIYMLTYTYYGIPGIPLTPVSRLGLRSNGEEGSLARRNKYLMGEAVRNAGIRAVLQMVRYVISHGIT